MYYKHPEALSTDYRIVKIKTGQFRVDYRKRLLGICWYDKNLRRVDKVDCDGICIPTILKFSIRWKPLLFDNYLDAVKYRIQI